jgi:hypothetical protein
MAKLPPVRRIDVVYRPPNKRLYRSHYGGAIKTIWEKFIQPAITKLLVYSEERSIGEGLSRFFHEDTRSCHFAVVLTPFTIPGKEWIGGQPPSNDRHMPEGYLPGNRRVKPGDFLFVRIDDVLGEVDIEFDDSVFTMRIEAFKKYYRMKIALVD